MDGVVAPVDQVFPVADEDVCRQSAGGDRVLPGRVRDRDRRPKVVSDDECERRDRAI